jgi:serine/threonine protein phosphatase PrpC
LPGSGFADRLPAPQSSMLALEFAQISDIGRVREGNEDFLGHVSPETPEQAATHGWLFALADGVGGHEKGEVASQTAVESMLEGFRVARKEEALPSLMRRLVQSANARVFEAALKSGVNGAGMATTLVACALRYDRAVVGHVGDSRCYLIRRNGVTTLTRDHTVAHEHVKLGLLAEHEIAEADTRHVLTRSLGGGLFVDVEINEHQVSPGDVLLLCSDGLHGALTSSDLAQVVGPGVDLRIAAEQLVALANDRDGSDNVSAQLIRVQNVERVGMYRGRPYKLR